MGLQERLDQYKRGFLASGKATTEMQATMRKSTDELRSSGILEHTLKVGQRAPAFALPNQDGQTISAASLIERGALVISFFRGIW